MILTLLSITFAMIPSDPTWADTGKADMQVTLGSVVQTESGYLTVVGPKERALRKSGTHQDATLQFQYRGRSQETSLLASGRFVSQIGLKMRSKDTCNLLYVMWRIEPEEQIVVTLKSNPGKSAHSDCGARGYTTIAAIPLRDIGVTATTQQSHRLRTRIDESNGDFTCTVYVDDKKIWTGPLNRDLIAPINGPVGFRTDNGSFIFKLLVAE